MCNLRGQLQVYPFLFLNRLKWFMPFPFSVSTMTSAPDNDTIDLASPTAPDNDTVGLASPTAAAAAASTKNPFTQLHPHNVTLLDKDLKFLTISWSPPEEFIGNVSLYRVYYVADQADGKQDHEYFFDCFCVIFPLFSNLHFLAGLMLYAS